MEAPFNRREIRDEILSADGNVISIETDVNFGGAGDHVMQNIHKKNKKGRRERAALLDTSMEVNTKGIRPISGSEAMSIIKKCLDSIAVLRG
jgi:hypothetical protein